VSFVIEIQAGQIIKKRLIPLQNNRNAGKQANIFMLHSSLHVYEAFEGQLALLFIGTIHFQC